MLNFIQIITISLILFFISLLILFNLYVFLVKLTTEIIYKKIQDLKDVNK